MSEVITSLTPSPSPDGRAPSGEGRIIEGIEIPVGVQVKLYQDEIRLYHLEAAWMPRGDLVRFERRFACKSDCPRCHGKGCEWHLHLALVMLEKDERISQGIEEAAAEYGLRTGNDPMYAWVRRMGPKVPKVPEVSEVPEVYEVGGVEIHIFAVDWMPERAVAVGRGN